MLRMPQRASRLGFRAGGAALMSATLALALVDDAQAQCETYSCEPYTFMLSQSTSGGMPNGASRNAAISQDDRYGRVAAFESDASNIVSGDTNGKTDVFSVSRAGPYGTNGTRWRMGARRLITKSPSGAPANGDSYKPAVSGNVEVAPKCIAFVSEASNLVSGDTNGQADAFVYSLASGTISRISVSSSGRQSNGRTFDVAVDGRCERVAFTSNATNLSLTSTSRSQWKSAVTTNNVAGRRQVYSRFIAEPKYSSSGLKGLTFLASAVDGRAGNDHSGQPTMPSRRGDAVGFTSLATNLSSVDRNAFYDVYWRQMPLVRISAGSTPKFRTNLLSRSRTGGASNGHSTAPAASGNHYDSPSGSRIAFETLSTNVGGAFTDSNGVSDIVRAVITGTEVTTRYNSNGQYCKGLGNAASQRPAISEAGSTVLYDTDASNFTCYSSGADRNGAIADIFVWTERRVGSILWSFDTNTRPLTMDSRNPATSARTNYYLWETRDPFADIALASREGYYDDPHGARNRAAEDPGANQVFMRYGGPE